MKNWKEFKILGVSIMEERNGRTRIRIPWRWVRMGVLVGWPIAGLWVHLAYLALRAGDLDEAAGFSTGIVLFGIVMPAGPLPDGKDRGRPPGAGDQGTGGQGETGMSAGDVIAPERRWFPQELPARHPRPGPEPSGDDG
jgi:hypothetical protein